MTTLRLPGQERVVHPNHTCASWRFMLSELISAFLLSSRDCKVSSDSALCRSLSCSASARACSCSFLCATASSSRPCIRPEAASAQACVSPAMHHLYIGCSQRFLSYLKSFGCQCIRGQNISKMLSRDVSSRKADWYRFCALAGEAAPVSVIFGFNARMNTICDTNVTWTCEGVKTTADWMWTSAELPTNCGLKVLYFDLEICNGWLQALLCCNKCITLLLQLISAFLKLCLAILDASLEILGLLLMNVLQWIA